ncbi:hypothetical protein [Streptomyces albireticuli]|nr:hypothetical protein [Streptomyces albireticuli]
MAEPLSPGRRREGTAVRRRCGTTAYGAMATYGPQDPYGHDGTAT